MKRVVLSCAPLVVAVALVAAELPAANSHPSFTFTQAGRHVTVWYFVPPGATSQAPVVFVMHGVRRDGENYLADWIPYAQKGYSSSSCRNSPTRSSPARRGCVTRPKQTPRARSDSREDSS